MLEHPVTVHGPARISEGVGGSLKCALTASRRYSNTDRCFWAHVAIAVQMRSHHRCPRWLRVPWVMQRTRSVHGWTRGADVGRIYAISGVQRTRHGQPGHFSIDEDVEALERCIAEVGARLCIVDPVSAFLGDRRDSHRNSDIRGLLGPLGELAARHRCAVVVVTHLNKSSATRALYRSMGSLAFMAAARAAWLVVKDKDDPARRLMLPLKANLIRDRAGIAFRIDDGRVCLFPVPIHLDPDAALATDCPTRDGTDEPINRRGGTWS